MDSITKKCNTCGQKKNLSEFTEAKKRSNGRHSICKDCKREYDKKYRDKNANRIAESQSQYYKENKTRIRENFHAWYENNKSKVRESARKWIIKNTNRHNEYQKKWHKENAAHCNEYSRNRYANNREELVVKECAKTHKRRSRIAGNGGSYTAKQWKDLCAFYGNKCLCCGKDNVKLTVDHVVPTKLGGTSNIDNLQPLCLSCNCSKSARIIDYRFDKGEFARNVICG
jgi:hypothetical protein